MRVPERIVTYPRYPKQDTATLVLNVFACTIMAIQMPMHLRRSQRGAQTRKQEKIMTSQESTTHAARLLRLQHLSRVAPLLFLGLQLTGPVHGAEDAADPYDALYDVIMNRYMPDGKSYAGDESAPTIYS